MESVTWFMKIMIYTLKKIYNFKLFIMVTFLLLIGLYLCVVITSCLLLFYYKDVDGDYAVDGNTVGELLHLRGKDSSPFLIYFPVINVFFFILLIILISVDLFMKLLKYCNINFDMSDRINRILGFKIK